MNPLPWLADRLLFRAVQRRASSAFTSAVSVHRLGFTRGWTACLLSMAICYVLYVAGLAILNTPLPPPTP